MGGWKALVSSVYMTSRRPLVWQGPQRQSCARTLSHTVQGLPTHTAADGLCEVQRRSPQPPTGSLLPLLPIWPSTHPVSLSNDQLPSLCRQVQALPSLAAYSLAAHSASGAEGIAVAFNSATHDFFSPQAKDMSCEGLCLQA